MTAPANSIDPVAPAWRSEATASPTELDPMRIEPLQNRVLVRPDKTPDRIGSIIVPDNARAKQHRGTVLQVGDGKYLENGRIRPMFVKPGIASSSTCTAASTPARPSSSTMVVRRFSSRMTM
jgi:hypothetical protein